MGVEETMDLYKVYNQVTNATAATRNWGLYYETLARAAKMDGYQMFLKFLESNGGPRQSAAFPWPGLSNGGRQSVEPLLYDRRPIELDAGIDDESAESLESSLAGTDAFPSSDSINFHLPTTPSDQRNVVTLADQFTWGAVVCAAVFIIVFVCIMMAWWVHKRKQDFARQDAERAADANVDAGADADRPTHCVRSAVAAALPAVLLRRHRLSDPPPSYNEVLRVGGAVGGDPGDGAPTLAAYDNRITVDELPPPFAEVEPYKAPPVMGVDYPVELDPRRLGPASS